MSRLDELSAELAFEEAKAAFIKAKEKNTGSGKSLEAYRETKKAYQEAKHAWRIQRPAPGPGDGVASPPAVSVDGGVS